MIAAFTRTARLGVTGWMILAGLQGPLPRTGTLTVTVRGLPAGAAAKLELTGPDGTVRQLAGPEVVTGLKAGRYSLHAEAVVADSFGYAPNPPAQTVTVTEGQGASADVLYLVADGALKVSGVGLRTGAHPTIIITGPAGYRRQLDSIGQTLRGLAPGGYVVEAADVRLLDSVQSPVPATQTRTVRAGVRTDVMVNYAGGPALLPQGLHVQLAPGYHDRTMRVDGVSLKYKLFIPASYDATVPTAVVLFAHGSGEGGVDNVQQTRVGLGPYLAAHVLDFPAVVIFPQQPPAGVFPRGREGLAAVHAMYLAALDSTLRQVNADTTRLYLTGVSAGAFRIWAMAFEQPSRFAAIAPVSGGVSVGEEGGRTTPRQPRAPRNDCGTCRSGCGTAGPTPRCPRRSLPRRCRPHSPHWGRRRLSTSSSTPVAGTTCRPTTTIPPSGPGSSPSTASRRWAVRTSRDIAPCRE